MLKTNYMRLQEKYGGKFVATIKGKVIAYADDSEKLVKMIKNKFEKNKNLTIGYIEPKGAICVYRVSLRRKINKIRSYS